MKYLKLACLVCTMLLPMTGFAQGVIRRSTPTKRVSPTKQVRKDNNQNKILMKHQDGRYSVMFKEVNDVKANDLKDFVQYAIKSGRKVCVTSFQDCKTGSVALNQKKCVKRAEDAATLLNNMGVEASQIEIVTQGGKSNIVGWRSYCIVSVSEE